MSEERRRGSRREEDRPRRGLTLAQLLAVLGAVLVAFGCIALSLQSRNTADKSLSSLTTIQTTLVGRCQSRSVYDLTIHDYLMSQVSYFRDQLTQAQESRQLNAQVIAALPPQLAAPIRAAQQRALASQRVALVAAEKAANTQVGGNCSQFNR